MHTRKDVNFVVDLLVDRERPWCGSPGSGEVEPLFSTHKVRYVFVLKEYAIGLRAFWSEERVYLVAELGR